MTLNRLYFLVASFLFGFTCFSLSSFVAKESNDGKYIIPVEVQNKANLQNSISRGKAIYTDFCIQCHLATGKGDLINFPPLDGSDWLTKKRKLSIHAVKFGQTGDVIVKGKKFNNVMPPLGLENQEVADVLNYVMNSWSNKQIKMVTLEEVKAVMQ